MVHNLWVVGGMRVTAPDDDTEEDLDLVAGTRGLRSVEPADPLGWFGALLDGIDEGFALLEVVRDEAGRAVDLRYLAVNPALARVSGLAGLEPGALSSVTAPGIEPWWLETYTRIAETGVGEQFERHIPQLDRWLTVSVQRIGHDRLGAIVWDTSAQHRAATAEQAREQRDAYLLALVDALRPIDDPVAIQEVAAGVLGRHLGAERVVYATVVEIDGEPSYVVEGGYAAPGLSVVRGPVPFDALGSGPLALARRGRVFQLPDLHAEPGLTPDQVATYDALGARSMLGVPLVKDGRLTAILAIAAAAPRTWDAVEVAIVEETAERTWSAVQQARAQAGLRLSEARYHSLFETIDEAFIEADLVRDADGQPVDVRYVDVNPAFSRMSGVPRDRLVGHLRSERFPSDAQLLARAADAVTAGRTDRFEFASPGSPRWFEVTILPRGGTRFAMLLDDVTERHRADLLLREREARQAFLVRLEDAIRTVTDVDRIHQVAAQMLGVHLGVGRCVSAEMQGEVAVVRGQYTAGMAPMPPRFDAGAFGLQRSHRSTVDIVRVDDAATDPRLDPDHRAAVIAAGVGASCRVMVVRDGTRVSALSVQAGAPRTWRDEEVALVADVANRTWDAAERARAVVALAASEAKHRLLFESIGEGFLLAELVPGVDGAPDDVRFLEVNTAFDTVTGGRGRELVGRLASEAAPTINPMWFGIAEQVGRLGKTVRIEHTDAPRGRWLESLFSPIGEPGSGLIAMIATDITDRRQADERRERLLAAERVAREEAEAASRLREEFLAIVSHELRTPLAGILLWTRLLSSGPLGESEKEALDAISRNAQALRGLVEDLLDASRMMAGGVTLRRRARQLGPLVVGVAESLRPLAAERGVELVVQPPEEVTVRADEQRLAQVVRNLVDNAIRYTPAGGRVVIGVRRDGEHGLLEVADTGPGIVAGELPRLFERFQRGVSGGGGLGLGLAIAREVVLLHGGTIEATRRETGQGSVFTVRLPAVGGGRRRRTPAEG